MLILAGVSINAIVGDNGIITNAQNANIKSGMAALEEFLQEKYVEYYNESENYMNKQELLAAKIPNLFFRDGTKNYITANGKMYYVIDKRQLPKEIKENLVGGDTTDYGEYIRLINIYGVTSDLKVYYYDSNGLEGGNVLGVTEFLEIDPTLPVTLINKNTPLKNNLISNLKVQGIEVSEEIINANIASLKNVTLDGTNYPISNLSGISELRSMKKLTLSNLELEDLSGIESCGLLDTIYIDNCIIRNYSKLTTVYGLNKLYIKIPNTMDMNIANDQVENLSIGLSVATKIENLEYFGIFGDSGWLGLDKFDFTSKYSSDSTHSWLQYESINSLTDISSISKFSSNIKKVYVIYI